MSEVVQLPEGCGYQGYEFGANYPDSTCHGGKLYDADDCDGEGNLGEPPEDIPCPMCNESGAVQYWTGKFALGGRTKADAKVSAVSLVADIRTNRRRGTEPWKVSR